MHVQGDHGLTKYFSSYLHAIEKKYSLAYLLESYGVISLDFISSLQTENFAQKEKETYAK